MQALETGIHISSLCLACVEDKLITSKGDSSKKIVLMLDILKFTQANKYYFSYRMEIIGETD